MDSGSTTGLDKVVALVRMAVRGEQAAIDVVREHALFWASNWPIIRHRVLRDRELWKLPEDTQARLDELRSGAPRPRLKDGTPRRVILRECARWATALYPDISLAAGALVRATADNGVKVDPRLATELIEGMRTNSGA